MSYILPLMILGLIIYALIKRVDIYSAFTEGAAEALPMLIRILPYMAGMLAAIQALRASGALELMLGALSPAFNAVGFRLSLRRFSYCGRFRAARRSRSLATYSQHTAPILSRALRQA